MLRKFTFIFAVIGVLLVLLITVVGGVLFPGYSHTSQYISELGAREAPQETLVRFGGFLPAGIFLGLFAILALWNVPRAKTTTLGFLGILVYAFGYFAAAIFPCDPGCRPSEPSFSQIVHNIAGLGGYLFAPISLAVLGGKAKGWDGGQHLAPLGYGAAGLALAGLLTLTPESPYVGISQRVIEVSTLTWIFLCALYIQRSG